MIYVYISVSVCVCVSVCVHKQNSALNNQQKLIWVKSNQPTLFRGYSHRILSLTSRAGNVGRKYWFIRY